VTCAVSRMKDQDESERWPSAYALDASGVSSGVWCVASTADVLVEPVPAAENRRPSQALICSDRAIELHVRSRNSLSSLSTILCVNRGMNYLLGA
jgi:hypothetical protein